MWTKSQQTAIDAPVADNLVSAAAGSGKTAVMVERIVNRVISGSVNIDRLLIVTYTNAAASELKSRLMQKIMEKLDTSEDTVNLNRQLMLINNASICTIHSFCLDILRNNFHRAGLDPAFKVADTGEIELARRDILTRIFNDYYKADDREFLNLVDCYTSKNDSALMDIVLKMYDFAMSTPEGVDFIVRRAEEFSEDNSWVRELSDFAKEQAETAVTLYNEALEICSFDENLTKPRQILSNERDMFSSLLRAPDWNSAFKALNAFYFDRLIFSKKADESDRARIKYLRTEAKNIYKKLSDTVITGAFEDIKEDIARTAPSVKKLGETVAAFHRAFSEYKLSKNMVDFADLEHMALSLLKSPDGSPSELAVALSERYEEIYVDEYQDCNSVQEEIFTMVSRKGKGEPNMFMVGDMKQSIYRFRGSEPALFKAKSDSYPDYGDGDGRFNKIVLNKNFRSREAVLNGVNSIFSQLMNVKNGELEYTSEEFLYYNEGSYEDVNPDMSSVDVVIIDENSSDSPAEDAGAEEGFSEELKGIEAEAVYAANRINEMIKSGYTVFDKEKKCCRAAKFSDFVILLRSVRGYAEVFSDILTTAQIPVYCDVGSGYYDTPEISFLICCIKIVDNPFDDIALLSVMRHPVYNFTDDDFVAVRTADRRGSFYDAVRKYIAENDDELSGKLKAFTDELRYFYERSRYLPSDKLIWEIVEKTDYMSYLSFLPNSSLKKANVRALFSRANDFEQTGYKGIFNFIRYIDSLRKSEADADTAKTLGEDENVVRIMSIHKSKGLEFPIVFLARSSKKFNMREASQKVLLHKDMGIGVSFTDCKTRLSYPLPQKNAIREKLRSEAMSEEMRVLYVALTRAREKLIITGVLKNAEKTLEETAVRAASSGNKIAPWISSSSETYLDWILLCIIRNTSTPFSKRFDFNCTIDDGSRFSVSVIPKDGLVFNVDDGAEKRNFSELAPLDGADEFVKSRLEYRYPYENLSSVAANMSVTELKRLENEEDDVFNFFEQYKAKTPTFLNSSDKPSAADIGTLTHFVMEKLKLDAVACPDDVKAQINELVEGGFMTENQAQYISCENIFRLVVSPLGRRMAENASALRREFSFKYLLDASQANIGVHSDEKIVVQGTIDAFFEDESGVVIVDYKTDRVCGNIGELKKRYTPQLKYYQLALEKCLGKKVCEKYIFLLDSGDVVRVDD